MDKTQDYKVDNLAKMDNPAKPANSMVFSQDESLNMDIFGLRWKLGPVKMFVNGAWVDLNGLVPYDEDGEPVMLSTGRINNMLPQISGSTSQNHTGPKPTKEFEMMSPEEEKELNIPPNDRKELFADAAIEIEMDSHYESTDSTEGNSSIPSSPVEEKITQDNNIVPDDDENRGDTIPHGKTSASTLQMELDQVRVRLANSAFLPEKVLQKDGGLPSTFTNIATLAPGSTFRFMCEYCTHGFNRKYRWKIHTKIHTGQLVHKCSCENCGGIPYRNFRTMRYHHNRSYY